MINVWLERFGELNEEASPDKPVAESSRVGEGGHSHVREIIAPGGDSEADVDDITAVKVYSAEPTASVSSRDGFDWVSEISIDGTIRHWRGGVLVSEVQS